MAKRYHFSRTEADLHSERVAWIWERVGAEGSIFTRPTNLETWTTFCRIRIDLWIIGNMKQNALLVSMEKGYKRHSGSRREKWASHSKVKPAIFTIAHLHKGQRGAGCFVSPCLVTTETLGDYIIQCQHRIKLTQTKSLHKRWMSHLIVDSVGRLLIVTLSPISWSGAPCLSIGWKKAVAVSRKLIEVRS